MSSVNEMSCEYEMDGQADEVVTEDIVLGPDMLISFPDVGPQHLTQNASGHATYKTIPPYGEGGSTFEADVAGVDPNTIAIVVGVHKSYDQGTEKCRWSQDADMRNVRDTRFQLNQLRWSSSIPLMDYEVVDVSGWSNPNTYVNEENKGVVHLSKFSGRIEYSRVQRSVGTNVIEYPEMPSMNYREEYDGTCVDEWYFEWRIIIGGQNP